MPSARTCAGGERNWSGAGGLVVALFDLTRDAAARRHGDAVVGGPGPDGARVTPAGRAAPAAAGGGVGLDRATGVPEPIDGLRQRGHVLLGELELPPLPVPAEPDRFDGLGPVEVVDQHFDQRLCHGAPISWKVRTGNRPEPTIRKSSMWKIAPVQDAPMAMKAAAAMCS